MLAATHKLDGRTVEVKRAIPREDSRDRLAPSAVRLDRRKVFVGGLAATVTDMDLRAYFERFGPVIDATVLIDRETARCVARCLPPAFPPADACVAAAAAVAGCACAARRFLGGGCLGARSRGVQLWG